MATQYTSILKLALPTTGELDGTWGDVVNNNITSMVEEAIAGLSTINTWTTNSHTLTTANGTTSESRAAILVLTDSGGALTGAGELICPNETKIYLVYNNTGEQITVKTSAGTGVDIPDGITLFVYCDGTNVFEAGGFNGQFADGTVASPSITFSSDTNTGLYRIGSGNYGFSSDGTEIAQITALGLTVGSKIRLSSNTDTFQWGSSVAGTVASFAVNFIAVGSIVTTASSTSYNTSSDYRLKENVVPIENAVARIDSLNPVRFNFTSDPTRTVDGFLAHEVTPVVPEAITGEKDAVDTDGNPVYQGIDQAKLVPLLVAAVQELSARVAELEAN